MSTATKAPAKRRPITAVRTWKIVRDAVKATDTGSDATVGSFLDTLKDAALEEVAAQ
jgi:hypothetical protein